MERSTEKITILVVEDESLVRMNAVDILEDAGYAVFEAHRGDAALAQLDEHPEIAILFSDINMPGMDGCTLAREVHRRRPDIALVLTSGMAWPDEKLTPICQFVPKPYMADSLLKTLGNASV